MLTYLIDPNIISYLADPASEFHERVLAATQRLQSQRRLAIPLLTLYELAYGFRRDPGLERMMVLVRDGGIEVLVPSEAGAEVFAQLKDAFRLHTGARKHELARHNVDFIVAKPRPV
jgi:predicted nucleic acid-binding protein